MLFKSMATSAVALTLVLGSVGMVSAYGGRYHFSDSSELTVRNEDTMVINVAGAFSNTGDNEQEVETRSVRRTRSTSADQTMTTGSAASDALADSTVNSTYVEGDCGCEGLRGDRETTVINHDTFVGNGALAASMTGDNEQEVEGRRGTSTQTMRTGNTSSLSTGISRVNMTDLRVVR